MTSTHLKIKDVAAELQISTMQAHSLVTGGDLPAINVGRGSKAYWRVSRADLDTYIADKRAETARRFGGGAA